MVAVAGSGRSSQQEEAAEALSGYLHKGHLWEPMCNRAFSLLRLLRRGLRKFPMEMALAGAAADSLRGRLKDAVHRLGCELTDDDTLVYHK